MSATVIETLILARSFCLPEVLSDCRNIQDTGDKKLDEVVASNARSNERQ